MAERRPKREFFHAPLEIRVQTNARDSKTEETEVVFLWSTIFYNNNK
jgi:hypothetical protein|tara:strand:+ start:213 stop:353 length:141 start_codon:yes stop_codon:yes gene_type:complete